MSAIGDITAKSLQRVGVERGVSEVARTVAPREEALLKAATSDGALAADALKVSPKAAKLHAPNPKVKGNVLVTYLTVGNGHQKAAEAIADAMHRQYPGVNVSTVDLASVSKLGKLMAKLFYPLVDSGFYPKFYEMTNHPVATSGLFPRIARWFTQKMSGDFLKLVGKTHPDAVVSTHLLGARLVGDAIDRGTLPESIHNFQVVTDEYGHGTYVMPHLDGTFVPSPEVADQLVKKGLEKQEVQVTGIPINPVFAEAPKANIRAALGFDPKARVLLVQGNLVNDVQQYEALLSQLKTAYPEGVNGKPIQVAVVCGKNAELKSQLEALGKTSGSMIQVKPFGYLSAPQMRDLMQASDLSLTKPGGLTTAESVATGLPMVLLDVMKGGQETYNAEHFSEVGAALSANDVDTATQKVVSLLGNDKQLKAMHNSAERVGKPDAAAAIADATAASLPHS